MNTIRAWTGHKLPSIKILIESKFKVLLWMYHVWSGDYCACLCYWHWLIDHSIQREKRSMNLQNITVWELFSVVLLNYFWWLITYVMDVLLLIMIMKFRLNPSISIYTSLCEWRKKKMYILQKCVTMSVCKNIKIQKVVPTKRVLLHYLFDVISRNDIYVFPLRYALKQPF